MKGIKRYVAKTITIDDFRHTLETKEPKIIEQNVIKSYVHKICSKTIKKVALSANDDKVYLKKDGVQTYNIGHYKTK